MNGLNFGSLTPEERQIIMEHLGDLTGQEEDVQRQFALANALRTEPSQRMDWASQAGRAVSGIGSALGMVGAQKGRTELGGKYRTLAEKLARANRRRPDEMAGTLAGYEDIWGRS